MTHACKTCGKEKDEMLFHKSNGKYTRQCKLCFNKISLTKKHRSLKQVFGITSKQNFLNQKKYHLSWLASFSRTQEEVYSLMRLTSNKLNYRPASKIRKLLIETLGYERFKTDILGECK